MKKTNLFLLTLSMLVLFVGCKKTENKPPKTELTSFIIEAANNAGIQQNIIGDIQNNQVFIRIPNALDITKVKPSFVTSPANSIVYVNSDAQQSGVTEQDFSGDVTYRVVSEFGQAEYVVKALKNAAIISFGFDAEDNEDYLFRDYDAEISGLNIHIKVPVTADITKLKARFTTTSQAVVKVNGQTQTSGTNEQDYTQGVTFEVEDGETTTPEKFVVTVSRLTAPEWTKLPVAGLDDVSVNNLDIAINPENNNPYIVYVLGASSAEELEDRKAVVAGFADNHWSYVGSSSGFSAGRTDLSTIAFDSKGALYAAYKDYDESGDGAVQRASVQKFSGNSWTYVGAQKFTDHRVNYLSIAVGADDIPVIGYSAAFADAGLAKRAPYSYRYDGSWQGMGLSAMSTVYFAKVVAGNDGAVYFVGMDATISGAERNPSVFKLTSNSWTPVGNGLISPDDDTFGAILIDAAANKQGEVYVVYQSQPTADKKSYIMHYDGSNWSQMGDEIPHTAGSNAERDNIALAVHPDGTVYLAYSDATGLFVRSFNKDTNNWNAEQELSSVKAAGIEMEVSNDGVVYIATTQDGKPVVFKYDIPE